MGRRRRRRYGELFAIFVLLLIGAWLRLCVSRDWVFAGSDSYAYVRLGDEWAEHGRFALGPDEPLEWYRRPLYPLFVRAVRVGTHAAPSGDAGWAGWMRIERAQIAIDVVVTGLLVLVIARRLGGRIAGLVALALAMTFPATVWFSCGILTEPMLAALTMAVLACLVLGRERPRRWFPVAALFVALAAYLRPDGPLLAVAFVPALWSIGAWRQRLVVAALSTAVFVAVFAPWPLRNRMRVGAPHLADGMVDRYGHDVPHYRGYWRWLQTWASDGAAAGELQACFYNVKCQPTLASYQEHGAFRSFDERQRVSELLRLRTSEGVSERVSDGFATLAQERRAAHPWRVLVALPLRRAWAMWSSAQDEPIANPRWEPWPSVTDRVRPHLPLIARALLVGVVVAAIALVAHRQTRAVAAVLATTIVARTALLAWSAYSLPRYLVSIDPVSFVLVGAAIAELARLSSRIAAKRAPLNRGARVTSASESYNRASEGSRI
jgi:hypothetical protein